MLFYIRLELALVDMSSVHPVPSLLPQMHHARRVRHPSSSDAFWRWEVRYLTGWSGNRFVFFVSCACNTLAVSAEFFRERHSINRRRKQEFPTDFVVVDFISSSPFLPPHGAVGSTRRGFSSTETTIRRRTTFLVVVVVVVSTTIHSIVPLTTEQDKIHFPTTTRYDGTGQWPQQP